MARPGKWFHLGYLLTHSLKLKLREVYFELSVEKVGEGGLLGLALQNADARRKQKAIAPQPSGS